MWEYRVTVDEVIDGDTIDVTVDLGFETYKKVRLRLSGVDTHETYGVDEDSKEFRLGKRETRFVESWCKNADEIRIRTEKTGKYGRWLAKVYSQSGAELNQELRNTFDVAA